MRADVSQHTETCPRPDYVTNHNRSPLTVKLVASEAHSLETEKHRFPVCATRPTKVCFDDASNIVSVELRLRAM